MNLETSELVYAVLYTGENLSDIIPLLSNRFISISLKSRIQFKGEHNIIRTVGKNMYFVKAIQGDIEVLSTTDFELKFKPK